MTRRIKLTDNDFRIKKEVSAFTLKKDVGNIELKNPNLKIIIREV
jgi:hypothetical protein